MTAIVTARLSMLSCDTLQPYGPSDEPWRWDVDHIEPDVNGQSWKVGE
jgi:hypothetical protein